MLKRVLFALVVVSLVGITATGCPRLIPAEGVEEGLSTPDFSLPSVNGELVTLSELRGHPVIINFWATWCGWCVIEMPHLQAVYEEHAGEGLVLLAVNIGESQDKVASFKQSNNLTFTILLDSQEAVTLKYDVTGYPATFFIDKDGIIRAKKLGAFLSKEEIERWLDEIMP